MAGYNGGMSNEHMKPEMETAMPQGPSHFSVRIAIFLALIALLLNLKPYIFRDRVSYPGVSYVRLNDSDTGEQVGFILAQYGSLTIARIANEGRDRTELRMRSDGSLGIVLQNKGRTVSWSLTEEGPKFQKGAP
jgi:hypothetical protein